MKTRWGLVLAGPFLFSFLLLVASQFMFLKSSFYADLGYGKVSATPDLANYIRIVSDRFYLSSLWLTTYISAIVALSCIVAGFPIAHVLARLRSRWTKLATERPDLVKGLRPLVTVRDTGAGKPVEVRLLVGPMTNVNGATDFCSALASPQYLCRPAVFDGQRLTVQ